MRALCVGMILGCAAFAGVATAAYCCGVYGGDSQAVLASGVKVPADIKQSVIRGNVLFAILSDGRLISVHLTKGDTKILGTFDLPAPALDAVMNKVCIASKNRVMIVDLEGGKITQADGCDHEVGALGFLNSERLYLQSGPQIRVLDLASGKTVHSVTLGKDDPKQANRGYRTLGRSGTRLFVGVAGENDAVAVVDLEKGEVADRISAAELHYSSSHMHPTDVLFAGEKAYVLESRIGYGVWTEKLGVVDLKTRQYTALKLPMRSMQHPSLVPGPDGTVLLTTYDGTFQIDAAGKRNAVIVAPNDVSRVGNQLLGMWQGKVLVSDRQELRQVPMPVVAAQGQ